MVIVVILPLPQLLVEQVNVVADAALVEELIELLVIDAMCAFDRAVETRRSRPAVDVPNVTRLEMPVEFRLELGAVVPSEHEVGRSLVAAVVHLQHAKTCAVVDRRELIETAMRARDSFQEFHLELPSVAGLRLLLALPARTVRAMLLTRRPSMHAVPREDTGNRGDGDRDLMKPLPVRGDSPGPAVVMLPQGEDVADDLASRGSGRAFWRPRPIAQARVTLLGVPALPLVERLTRDPEAATHPRYILLPCRLL